MFPGGSEMNNPSRHISTTAVSSLLSIDGWMQLSGHLLPKQGFRSSLRGPGVVGFLLGLILVSGLLSLYYWQVNVITDIRQTTAMLRSQAEELEDSNTSLKIQLVQRLAPGYPDEKPSE